MLEEYGQWAPTISYRKLYFMQINSIGNPIGKYDKEAGNVMGKPMNWAWFKEESAFIQQQQLKQSFIGFNSEWETLRQKYKKFLLRNAMNLLQRNARKIITEKKQQLVRIKVITQVLKDILIQTWEKFAHNLISNVLYGYCLIHCQFRFELGKEVIGSKGRVTFTHLRWITQAI